MRILDAKNIRWIGGLVILTMLTSSGLSLADDWAKPEGEIEIRVSEGWRDCWAAYIGSYEMSESDFFRHVGRFDKAAAAREFHGEKWWLYGLGLVTFGGGIVWYFHSLDNRERRSEAGTAPLITIGLGATMLILNLGLRRANCFPSEVAIEAAEDYNRRLQDQ